MAVNCPSLLTIPIHDPHERNSALEEIDPMRQHLDMDHAGEHHLSSSSALAT